MDILNSYFRYFDDIMLKYSREKEIMNRRLDAWKEERVRFVKEKTDSIISNQKQLKYYSQVSI